MSAAPRLVILGSSVTALAVARNAADLGMRPILIDTAEDIATSTRRADIRIFRDAPADMLLEQLAIAAAGTPTWLIATSDAWLRFIIEYRETLVQRFAEILHPDNRSLATCLDKVAFSQWCSAHGLPMPSCYEALDILKGSIHPRFPLLLRPRHSNPATRARLPKAVEAHDLEELARWMRAFDEVAVPALVTESLLGRRLTQFSVGAVRRGDKMMTFVAIKRRPLPEVCGVGSYVELSPDAAAETLARRALDALDYRGIAEVEILRDEDTRQDYLIEINARPWVQYALGPASGHDLLSFMLSPERHDPRRATTRGRRWLDLSADAYYCFSRTVGLVRDGRIPFGAYLATVLRANTFAYLSLSDPGPAWRNLRQWFKALVKARGERERAQLRTR